MEYEEIKKSLERDYLIIKKGKWWSFLGEAVTFVVIAGLVSYQAGLRALEGHAATKATTEIERLAAEAKTDREKIKQNLAKSENRLSKMDERLAAMGKVRVQTGRVRINRAHLPELLQPNCSSHVERGEKQGRVDFQEPFTSTPKVIMALSAIDVSDGANGRFHVIVKSAGAKGFEYKFVTWCDTSLHWAEAHWIAVAQ